MHDATTALLFVKLPRAGEVKTRLGLHLGNSAAALLYSAFARDQRDALLASGLPVTAVCVPSAPLEDYRGWLGPDVAYIPQRGADLGERMMHAFLDAFEDGAKGAVLTGSDAPHLTPTLIHEAKAALTMHDAAIAPSSDGGYSLIAMTQSGFVPQVFRGIRWSTPEVFRMTRAAFALASASLKILPTLDDIDTVDDLMCLRRRFGETGGPRRTMRLLREGGILAGRD